MFVIFISIILRFNQIIEILVLTTWILHPWIFRWKFLWRYKKIVKCVCQYIRNKCQSQTSLTLKWILCLQSYRPYTSEKLSNWCGSPLFLFLLSFVLCQCEKVFLSSLHIFWYKTWSFYLDFFLWVPHPYFDHKRGQFHIISCSQFCVKCQCVLVFTVRF